MNAESLFSGSGLFRKSLSGFRVGAEPFQHFLSHGSHSGVGVGRSG